MRCQEQNRCTFPASLARHVNNSLLISTHSFYLVFVQNESKGSKSSSLYAIVIALISAALFGAATPASKTLLGDLSPFQLAGLLYLGAALGTLTVIIRRKAWHSPWRMDHRNQKFLLGAVTFGGIAGPVLLLLGLQIASAASVSMWLNLEMVATAILGRLVFHDHLGRYGWFGVAGIVAAGALLSIGDGVAGVYAGLLVAAACFCWGLDNHFTALIDAITPSQSTFWKGLVAGTVNLAIGLGLYGYDASIPMTFGALGVGIMSYGISITLYIGAAQGLGATRAQMFFASAPFFGVALSTIMLGESISSLQWIAAAILVISLPALFRDQHHHVHVHEETTHEHSHRHDDNHHRHEHPRLPASHRHTHRHKHERMEHAHPHWPDLHHRHRHDQNESSD
jgi:drug/metabolite transporter (DMT)-like permease